jgi:hypothetical protein
MAMGGFDPDRRDCATNDGGEQSYQRTSLRLVPFQESLGGIGLAAFCPTVEWERHATGCFVQDIGDEWPVALAFPILFFKCALEVNSAGLRSRCRTHTRPLGHRSS